MLLIRDFSHLVGLLVLNFLFGTLVQDLASRWSILHSKNITIRFNRWEVYSWLIGRRIFANLVLDLLVTAISINDWSVWKYFITVLQSIQIDWTTLSLELKHRFVSFVEGDLGLSNQETLHTKQSSHIQSLLHLKVCLFVNNFGSSTFSVTHQKTEKILKDSLVEILDKWAAKGWRLLALFFPEVVLEHIRGLFIAWDQELNDCAYYHHWAIYTTWAFQKWHKTANFPLLNYMLIS